MQAMKTNRARWFTKGRTAPIRVVVIHDMEASEAGDTAERVAQYFHTTSTKASAHICVDNDSAVRCVDDDDTAWAAPGCNHVGLQLEIAGYARQSRAEWLDDYSKAALGQAAKVTAAWCVAYDVPVVHLTVAQLKAGKRGIVGHVDVSNAYKRTDHGDPGPGFPWDYFLGLVRDQADMTTEDIVKALPLLKRGSQAGEHVETLQGLLIARSHREVKVTGVFDKVTEDAVKEVQEWGHLDPDGRVGPKTWPVLLRVHI